MKTNPFETALGINIEIKLTETNRFLFKKIKLENILRVIDDKQPKLSKEKALILIIIFLEEFRKNWDGLYKNSIYCWMLDSIYMFVNHRQAHNFRKRNQNKNENENDKNFYRIIDEMEDSRLLFIDNLDRCRINNEIFELMLNFYVEHENLEISKTILSNQLTKQTLLEHLPVEN